MTPVTSLDSGHRLRFCPDDPVRRDHLAVVLGKLELAICESMDPAAGCSRVPAFCGPLRPDCCLQGEHKKVFVSGSFFSGNLVLDCNNAGLADCSPGLDAADSICTYLASLYGFGGTWRAWLSDDTGYPGSRFSHSAVPYCRIDKTIVAQDWADLIACSGSDCLAVPINVTADGGISNNPVWTNTLQIGTPSSADSHCDGWTTFLSSSNAGIGYSDLTDTAWTASGQTLACEFGAQLYCFEQ